MLGIPDDLNKLEIPGDDGFTPLDNHRAVSADGLTTVLFKELEAELITRISHADIVVGCVAWLTSRAILEALRTRRGVCIIVQKEDFLRPDLAPFDNWRARLRELYQALPNSLERYYFAGTILQSMSVGSDPSLEPIRCVGNLNSDRLPAFPRAHHKFALFCTSAFDGDIIKPHSVWTGSFNFTKNATCSFENAVVSRDSNLVRAFYREFAQVAALSEPLDWESEWVEPQWRIGT